MSMKMNFFDEQECTIRTGRGMEKEEYIGIVEKLKEVEGGPLETRRNVSQWSKIERTVRTLIKSSLEARNTIKTAMKGTIFVDIRGGKLKEWKKRFFLRILEDFCSRAEGGSFFFGLMIISLGTHIFVAIGFPADTC